jgi:hypothetical protein
MAGGGVGEAMLIGAITGAGTSAVTGGDPLKGALLGAAGGGLGAGVAGATTGATAGTTAGATGTTAAAAPTAAAGTATAAPTAAGLDATLTAVPDFSGTVGMNPNTGAGVISDYSGTVGLNPNTGAGLDATLTAAPADYSGTVGMNPNTGAGAVTDYSGTVGLNPNTGAGSVPDLESAKEGQKLFPNISELYGRNPVLMPAASGAVTSAAFNPFEPEEEEEEEYSGALKDFKYTRSGYTPYRAAASGGLMDTAVARRLMSGGQLGSYSDGGQALQGPGDGMSDSIPGVIGGAQPARLADGEFVVPADVVSGIGNGSTDAGSRQLYAMMDKIREARTGRAKQAPEINPRKMMPA